MRSLILILLLAGCAAPSGGIDWFEHTHMLQISGDMRTERVPEDAPISRDTLTQNFRKIAFEVEENPIGIAGGALQSNDDPHLRKWLKPARYEIFALGEDESRISPMVKSYLLRLATITGHPIPRRSTDPQDAEAARLFVIYGPDEVFAWFVDTYLEPSGADNTSHFLSDLATLINRWRFAASPCAGQVTRRSGNREGTYKGEILMGVVLIKREIPENLLETCVEEELAQTMGLLNDDKNVRPSIFNDDQEFALLTRHDELLLRILYDRRLTPGMAPETAMPIVDQIISELVPDSRS